MSDTLEILLSTPRPDDPDWVASVTTALTDSGRFDDALAHIDQHAQVKGFDAEAARARVLHKKNIYQRLESILTETDTQSYIGDDDLVTLTKDDITVRFHVKNASLDLTQIIRTLKRTQTKVFEKLDVDPCPVEVFLTDTKTELLETAEAPYPSWIGGLTDNVIHINTSPAKSPEPQHLYVMLTHEYVHLALRQATAGRCPRWLDEGLALNFSQELSPDYQAVMEKAVANDALLPLETLENDFSALGDRDLIRLAYAQSESITTYLIEYLGWEKIAAMIQGLQNKPLQILLKERGLNYYLLERGWRRWRTTTRK